MDLVGLPVAAVQEATSLQKLSLKMLMKLEEDVIFSDTIDYS